MHTALGSISSMAKKKKKKGWQSRTQIQVGQQAKSSDNDTQKMKIDKNHMGK
jgi:hypothetical protein